MPSTARYPTVDTTDALVVDQLTAHPTLKPFDGKTSRHALAAKNARLLLRKAYPKVKFTITSETYSMGSSLTVGWDLLPGAPASDEVQVLVKPFQYGEPDSMTDGYDYDRDPQRKAFREAFGSVKYATAQGRRLSPEEIVAIEAKVLRATMDETPSAPTRGARSRL